MERQRKRNIQHTRIIKKRVLNKIMTEKLKEDADKELIQLLQQILDII